MKTLFASALAMMISFGAFSQDTLVTRNGQVILGKVYEINQTDIKYRKPSKGKIIENGVAKTNIEFPGAK